MKDKDSNKENLSVNAIKLKNEFISFIEHRLGIVIHSHQESDLINTIVEGCIKFNCNPYEYAAQLHSAQNNSPMLEHLVAGVTVGETYFYRDKHQMEALQDQLLPSLIQKKRAQNDLSLRIWSAGCSSGEEIYTIAMMLHELLPDLSKWNINLLGTDINERALQKAIKGEYGKWSMRSIPNYLRDKYFIHKDEKYTLIQAIRDLAKFDYLNLNEDSYPSILNGTNTHDLIICRNVLIYFEAKIITTIMQKLSACLITNGYLFLGSSDPIDIKSTNLKFDNHQALLFINSSAKEEKVLVDEVKPKANLPKPVLPKISKEIPNPVTKAANTSSRKSPEHYSVNMIQQLMAENKWEQVIKLINAKDIQGSNSFNLLTAKATAFANVGQLSEAEKLFEQALKINSTDKYTYLTYALTLIELNKLPEAEQALRKTVFLDHQFVVGHYQLGLLLLRMKRQEAGVRCLDNALSMAKLKSPTDAVQGSYELNYARLVEILEVELSLYTV